MSRPWLEWRRAVLSSSLANHVALLLTGIASGITATAIAHAGVGRFIMTVFTVLLVFPLYVALSIVIHRIADAWSKTHKEKGVANGIEIDLSWGRLRIAIPFTLIMSFILFEKYLGDYWFHVTKRVTFPDWGALWPSPLGAWCLASILIFLSFVIGKEYFHLPSPAEVRREVVFTAATIYLAYAVGLFGRAPFAEWLVHLGAFLVVVFLLYLLYRRATPRSHSPYAQAFSGWVVGSALLTLACFGFHRAVTLNLRPDVIFPSVLDLRHFIEFWKDIILCTVLGCVLLQGMHRILIAIQNEPFPGVSQHTRATIFGCYFITVIVAVVLLYGMGDMAFINSSVFQKEYSGGEQDVIRFHIYLRDLVLLVFIVLNTAWVFYRLFVAYQPLESHKSKVERKRS